MDYIVLEQSTLCLMFVLFMLLFLGFCLMGFAWTKSERKCEKFESLYKKERSRYNRLLGIYHRDTFKLPEVNDDV